MGIMNNRYQSLVKYSSANKMFLYHLLITQLRGIYAVEIRANSPGIPLTATLDTGPKVDSHRSSTGYFNICFAPIIVLQEI
jgi:hypothetical protein